MAQSKQVKATYQMFLIYEKLRQGLFLNFE